MAQPIFDTVPDVHAAGILHLRAKDDSAQATMVPAERPRTPDRVQRWRRSYFEARLGEKALPVGLRDPLPVSPQHRFGAKSGVGSTQDGVFGRRKPLSELSDYFEQKKEALYRRSKREPIGQPYIRGYEWPAHTQTKEFKFGIESNHDGAGMAESVIMPSNERHLMRRCDPGSEELEQKQKQKIDLHYNWEAIGIDPRYHTFGSVPVGKLEKAATSMEQKIGTKIELLRSANIKVEQQWPVGRSRPLPAGVRQLPDDFMYGSPKQQEQGWGVKECIHELDPPEHQIPDADLGRISQKNIQSNIDYSRRYGMPSVRVDKVRPQRLSLADNTNYGDEEGASTSLYPPKLGSEFTDTREVGEIRDIFEASGLSVSDKLLRLILERGRQKNIPPTSLHHFRVLYNEITNYGERI